MPEFSNKKMGKNGKCSTCIVCVKAYYNENSDRLNAIRNAKYFINKAEINLANRLRYKNDTKYRERLLLQQRNSYPDKRIKCLNYQKEYAKKNYQKRNLYLKNRRHNDLNFKLTTYIRNRIGSFFINKKKPQSVFKTLGCNMQEFIKYIEGMFVNNMTWDSYGTGPGKWELDHIEPLCSFDLMDIAQFTKASHYTNMQPIWHEDHVAKTVLDFKKSLKKGAKHAIVA